MARRKAEMKCPYCDEVKAVSGMTSHVRARHTEHYKEFQENRAALVEKYKIVEGEPAPVEPPAPPAEDPAPPAAPEPEEPPKPDPKDQQSGSFLSSVGRALRDW